MEFCEKEAHAILNSLIPAPRLPWQYNLMTEVLGTAARCSVKLDAACFFPTPARGSLDLNKGTTPPSSSPRSPPPRPPSPPLASASS